MNQQIRCFIITLAVVAIFAVCHAAESPGGSDTMMSPPPADTGADQEPEIKRGLLRNDEGAFQGYTLFSPLHSTKTYLINMQGGLVHTWDSDATPGQSVYLLDNGNLLRTECLRTNRAFHGGGMGGRIREYAWDGTAVWEYVYSDNEHCQHHDIEPLPNGNVLLIAWVKKSNAEALAAGRDPGLIREGDFWPDEIVEIRPRKPKGGEVVWRWTVWDHLVQDLDMSKANYGVVAEHPELVDINGDRAVEKLSAEELEQLEALGYVTPAPRRQPQRGEPDWTHINSVDYNAELDQIVLSVHRFSEIWVIDHGTTTEQAAGHVGGRRGRGGDLLYRWGNPRSYGAGSALRQQFFAQHDAQWIESGMKGEGNLLVFNNGRGRQDGHYSSIDEIVPPLDEKGDYVTRAGKSFGPDKPVWNYVADKKESFFSSHISGAQRLPNGNTLICSGEEGRFFEVDQGGKVVWDYVNPFDSGPRPPAFPGAIGRHMPRPPGFSPDGPRAGDGPRRGRDDGPPGGGKAARRSGRGRDPRGMGPGGRGPGDGRGFGRRPGGPGPGMGGGVFRVTRIAMDHPALVGKELKAIGLPDEVRAEDQPNSEPSP